MHLETGVVWHFLVVPALVYVVSRLVLRLTHDLSLDDQVVLGQRFTRACIAVSFVYGGFTSLWRIPGFWGSLVASDVRSHYWLQGTVVFYVLDCALLVVYRQWNGSMWMHHMLAIVLFGATLGNRSGDAGCMVALLAEALVPWGFLLFYLRAVDATHSAFFTVVCFGGMATLVGRALLWTYCLLQLNVLSTAWTTMGPFFTVMVNAILVSAYYLEYTWFHLYLSSYRKSISSTSRMGTRTDSMRKL